MVEDEGTKVWSLERKYEKNSSRTRDEVQLLVILVVVKRYDRDTCSGTETLNRIQESSKERFDSIRHRSSAYLILSYHSTDGLWSTAWMLYRHRSKTSTLNVERSPFTVHRSTIMNASL